MKIYEQKIIRWDGGMSDDSREQRFNLGSLIKHKRIYKPLSEETKKKISESERGKIIPLEVRLKMSETHKGIISPNKGKKLSEEWKRKMSESHIKNGTGKWNKGKKLSKEHREKIIKSLIGRKHNLETRKKMSEAQKGIKGSGWKGGISSKNEIIRAGIEIRLWREAVFARDNWTCQKTGIMGGKLCVHHINNFADFPQLRTSIENGITLLRKAHTEFHKKYGKKNNTQKQLDEFLENE